MLRLTVSFDRIADRFDSTRSYPEHVMAKMVDAVSEALPEHARLLDAGVGTGRFAGPLQSRGFDVTGIDISGRMLGKAREKHVENLVRSDLRMMPFSDDSFTAALSVHVLHLISDWRRALSEIGRVTAVEFLSIAFDRSDSPAGKIGDFYDRVCEELGFSMGHPGMRERELPDLLPADSHTAVTVHEHTVDVRMLIEDYGARTYSSQWSVPEEIHVQAMERMRREYEGVERVTGRERISLLRWDIKRIRTLPQSAVGP